MTTRTLFERIERRINTLPPCRYHENNGGECDHYERTLPNGYEITIADGYAEPGYPNVEFVLLSNWNDESQYVNGPWREGLKKWVTLDDTASRLADSLGKLDGVGVDWRDEYTICDECNKAFRTVADSYSWQMYGAWNGDGYSCGDCIKVDPDAHIEDLINDSDNASTFLSANDLEQAGWIKYENGDSYSGDYHSGWYGREDSPATVMNDIHDSGIDDVIFVIEGVGQFEVSFAPYVRAQEIVDKYGHLQSLIDSAITTVEYLATH